MVFTGVRKRIVSDDIKTVVEQGVVIAVGTPGRVYDLIKRDILRTRDMRVLVLDEADDMLTTGFSEQIYEIFKFLPREIQVTLFSATMPAEVVALTDKFMRDPTRILVKRQCRSLDGIKQFYVAVEEEYKFATICDLYDSVSIAQSVIFCNTRRKAEWLADKLKENHTVSLVHSDMTKGERDEALDTFRSGATRVLICTDLVSRGIDVHHVSILINFDLPTHCESYLHRLSGSRRFGRKIVAINFVTAKAMAAMRELEAHYHTQIEELPMDFVAYLE